MADSHARVVVVGGGCVGINILYSLAKRGWSDVALLERTELTAGSTWHAAGLIPLYSFSYNFGRVIAKTVEIYEGLEAETGQARGMPGRPGRQLGPFQQGNVRPARTRSATKMKLPFKRPTTMSSPAILATISSARASIRAAMALSEKSSVTSAMISETLASLTLRTTDSLLRSGGR